MVDDLTLTLTRCSTDIAFFATEVLGIKLHHHQIDMLRLSQAPLHSDDNRNGLGEFPRQTGVSTALAIIAAHNILFNSGKTIGVVMSHSHIIDSHRQQVLEFVSKATSYFGFTGKLSEFKVDRTSIRGLGSLFYINSRSKNLGRGLSLSDVYIDTCELTDDTLGYLLPTLHSTNGRIFVYSTGRSLFVRELLNHFEKTNIPYQYLTVDPVKYYGVEKLNDFYLTLGDEMFAKEFLL